MTVWNEIRTLAFIVDANDVRDPMKFKIELDALFPKLGKREIVFCSEEKFKQGDLSDIRSITYFSEKDFNFFGRLKNQAFKDAMDQKFDAIFICGEHSKRITKALSKCKTNRFIGLDCTYDFIQINIAIKSSEPIEMVKFAKEILNQIT